MAKKISIKTELKQAKARIAELEDLVKTATSHGAKLKEILGLRSYEDWAVIFRKVISALEYRQRNEGAQDVFNGIISNENSKLWYLLRAITGDPTLKNSHEEANHNNVRRLDNSPYEKPRF